MIKLTFGVKFFLLGLGLVATSIFGVWALERSQDTTTASSLTPPVSSTDPIPVVPFTFPNLLNITPDIPTETASVFLRPRAGVTTSTSTTAVVQAEAPLWPAGRYRNLVFDETTAEKDITYKSTYHTIFSINGNLNYQLVDDMTSPVDLKLNIYQPAGDTQTKRPLIIFVYGGGWIDGDRYQQEASAIDFARRGYVTITMDYTMMPPGNELNPVPDPELLVYPRIVEKSATNIYEVYQWALARKDLYRIDESRIGLGGWSAGGLISQALVHIGSFPTPYGVRAVLGDSNILPAAIASAPPLGGMRTFSTDFQPVSMFASYEEDTGFAGTPNDHAADCAYLDSIGHRCITITYPGYGHDMSFSEPPNQADAVDFFATYIMGR